jgi:hypothetical protein
MKRYTTIGFLMGAAILTQVSTASAQRWGREAVPRAGVCFYEHVNFDGRYFCTPAGAASPNVPRGMNDKISSVRVFGDAAVTLYRDPNFRGQARVIDRNVADLRGLGFNDRLSSYQVEIIRGFARGGDRDRDGYGNARGREQPNVRSRWTFGEAQSLVQRSYQSVLGRNPDPEGLRNWTDQVMRNNWTERDLENALRQSDEYRGSRGDDRRR